MQLQTVNTVPALSLYTADITKNQPTYFSKDGIAQITEGAQVYLQIPEGYTYNGFADGRNDLTSMAIFNLDDAMDVPDAFYADRSSRTNDQRLVLSFDNIHTSATQFTDNSIYRCTRDGPMFFVISVGALNPVRIELTHVLADNSRETYEVMDLDTGDTTQNIVSRSVLVNCHVNDQFSIFVFSESGTYSGPRIQSSFGGFHYDPRHNNPVAWSAYRYLDVVKNPTAEADYTKVTFRDTLVDSQVEAQTIVNIPNGVFSQVNSRFTATTSGIYLVHFSASVAPGSVVDIGLFRDNEMVAAIYNGYTTHTGKRVVSRTVLVQVRSGQRLEIRASRDTALSSNRNSKEIAFMGMLIYEN